MADFVGGVTHGAAYAFDDIDASTTDGSLVDAVSGQRVRVLGVAISCGGTASTVVFNSKPAGSGTAISCIFNNSINLVPIPPGQNYGYFETDTGEGLSVSTGAGSTTGIQVIYEMVG